MDYEEDVMDASPTLRHTVGFGRKVGLPGYSNIDASIYLQFEMPAGASPQEVISKAEATWNVAAAAVYDRLGVPYNISETGEVTEDTESMAAEQLAQAFQAPAAPVPAAGSGGASPPYNARTSDKDERKANTMWAKARYSSNPEEFYDNRQGKASGEYKSTYPDFKHKTSGVGFWTN